MSIRIQTRALGIAILLAVTLALLLAGGIHATQAVSHAQAVSAPHSLAIGCPSTDAHC